MSGPVVKAVTEAVSEGHDYWASALYSDGGRWREDLRDTFLAVKKDASGPDLDDNVTTRLWLRKGQARAWVRGHTE